MLLDVFFKGVFFIDFFINGLICFLLSLSLLLFDLFERDKEE